VRERAADPRAPFDAAEAAPVGAAPRWARRSPRSVHPRPNELPDPLEHARNQLPLPRRQPVGRLPPQGIRVSGFCGNCPRYHPALHAVGVTDSSLDRPRTLLPALRISANLAASWSTDLALDRPRSTQVKK
jgi:hypothetical protein